MAQHNARIGLILFCVYAAFYAAFMLINALAADWMDVRPVAGVNLAVLSGGGLIVLAGVLAAVYGVLAKSPASFDEGAEQ